jgi:hypothetical protein
MTSAMTPNNDLPDSVAKPDGPLRPSMGETRRRPRPSAQDAELQMEMLLAELAAIDAGGHVRPGVDTEAAEDIKAGRARRDFLARIFRR